MSESEHGSLSIEERVRREQAHFEQLADELGNVWWGHKTLAGQTRLDQRRLLVEQWARIGPSTVVLEPGAGNGEFSSRLAKTGARIAAVELSPKQARMGGARFKNMKNLSFSVGDVTRLPFVDDSFDAVAGCSVLHHFPMSSALPEFRRVLKSSGRIFFTEPNMLNPQVAIEKNFASIGRRFDNSPDETAFVRWRIAGMLRSYGFVDVRVVPFDFLHPGTPDAWINVVSRMSRLLERLPLIREFAGSLLISAVMRK